MIDLTSFLSFNRYLFLSVFFTLFNNSWMAILACVWRCGERLLSLGLAPMSEIKGLWGTWYHSKWHLKDCFRCHSCCWLICLPKIGSHHQGSEQFGLSEMLDEHEHLLIPPPTVGSLKRKKKNFFFSRRNVLSENSRLSLWILFPQGWLFQHQARRHLFSGTQFPSPRRSPALPAKCRACWEV